MALSMALGATLVYTFLDTLLEIGLSQPAHDLFLAVGHLTM